MKLGTVKCEWLNDGLMLTKLVNIAVDEKLEEQTSKLSLSRNNFHIYGHGSFEYTRLFTNFLLQVFILFYMQ